MKLLLKRYMLRTGFLYVLKIYAQRVGSLGKVLTRRHDYFGRITELAPFRVRGTFELMIWNSFTFDLRDSPTCIRVRRASAS